MKAITGNFKEYGARCDGNSITFTFCAKAGAKKVGIVFFDNVTKKKINEIVLDKSFSIGQVYSAKILDINPDNICYLYSFDDELFMDPYATLVYGRDEWADAEKRATNDFRVFAGAARLEKTFKDEPVRIEPMDMVLYKLHMRGFTKGNSLSASRAGNYKGIIAKLPYLKKLGVTSLELMPVYDFEELYLEKKMTITSKGKIKESIEFPGKVNYWGYGAASYLAPKASYFGGARKACEGFRDLVRSVHKAGMELIMEMSFAPETDADLIIDTLINYVRYYHVDGFHILGCNAPIERLVSCPYLTSTKLFYEYINEELLLSSNEKHLFLYNDSFMNVTRQIQNHMNGSMVQFANHMRRQNQNYGFVNYMSNVCGFSLWDSYSYGEKHNLDNGEENRDGNNLNFSFNNGCEGKTNVKLINSKRFLDMRNAFASVFLSQSIPLIVAGDEAACTHEGNNNPYCQDNKTGYTVFTKSKNKEILTSFVRNLADFRKKHKCLRPEAAFMMNDYRHLGLPDMSFHGSEPWMMTIGEEQKALGVLFNGAYADENEDVYVCYNFHYDEVEMALPLLGPGRRWRQIFNTLDYNEKSDFNPKPINNQQSIKIPGSSITVLVGMKP